MSIKENYNFVVYPIDDPKISMILQNSWNSTIFHEPAFLQYHPKDRFKIKYFCMESDGNIHFILPAELIGDHLISPRGASWGGPVFIQKSLKKITDITRQFVIQTQSMGVNKISITLPPSTENIFRDRRIEIALTESGFVMSKEKPTSVVKTDIKNPEVRYSSQCRRLLRKSQKNTISFSKKFNIEDFYPIMEKNLLKFDATPTHSMEELIHLQEHYPDSIQLFSTIFEGRIAAGVLSFRTSENSKLAFYINQDYKYSNLGCMTYCLHNLILDCFDTGIDFLDLGVSMDLNKDNHENLAWSLLNFKESFGATYFSRNTYVWCSNGS